MNQQSQQSPQPQQQPQQQSSPSQSQIKEDLNISNDENDIDDQANEGFVVKMRGLPWSATADDIIKFLSILGEAKVKGGAAGVHLTMAREGRPSGEAYVEMESEEDLKAALKKDREHMGNRYIEVFQSKRSEMEWVIKKTGSTLDSVLDDNCVRLRGLPFGSTKDDIVQFFQGLEMTPDGITIATDFTGRSTGEAFVQFVDRENAEKALQKHKEKIGHRYIEIFRSSLAEIRNQALQRRPRQTPYDRMDRFGSSGGGSGGGGSGRFYDMPMRAGRNMKSFGNNGYDNGGGPWNSGRNMGGPRGGAGGSQGMMGGGGGGGGGGWNSNNWNAPPSRPLYVVHMRGLPFKANEDDIATFFEPLEPVEISILFNNNNRPSGEANVEFSNKDDAMRAMSKDKTYMQHRYIELFMDGPVGGGPGSGGNNFSMDDMGPPNTGNGGSFGGFGSNSFGGGGGGNSFGNNTFSRRNDNSGPPNSFFSNNMGGGGYPRPSGPRNMSGPGPKFNPF